MLGLWQTITGASPASTALGLAARDAATLGDAVWSWGNERMLRAYGSFSHPNVFGGTLALAYVAWISVTKGAALRVRIPIGVVLLIGLLATGSRAAALAAMVGAVSLAASARAPRRAASVTLALAAAVVAMAWIGVAFSSGSLAALRGGGERETRSLTERMAQLTEASGLMSPATIVVGHGIGTYVFALERAAPGKAPWSYQPVHVAPLLVLIEIGGLGVAALGWLFFILLRERRPVGVAMLGSLVVLAAFDHYLWTSWQGLALAGIVFAACLRDIEDTRGTLISSV